MNCGGMQRVNDVLRYVNCVIMQGVKDGRVSVIFVGMFFPLEVLSFIKHRNTMLLKSTLQPNASRSCVLEHKFITTVWELLDLTGYYTFHLSTAGHSPLLDTFTCVNLSVFDFSCLKCSCIIHSLHLCLISLPPALFWIAIQLFWWYTCFLAYSVCDLPISTLFLLYILLYISNFYSPSADVM